VKRAFVVIVVVAACSGTDAPISPDGGGGADASADGSSGARKRVFTSLAAPLGNFYLRNGGGIAEGDYVCQLTVDQGGFGGTFKAWLSDPTTSAIDRITGVGPWYLMDGTTLVFQNRAELLTGPRVPIDRNEFGEVVGSPDVWTGTVPAGTASGDNCGAWKESGAVGTTGRADQTGSMWTQAGTFTCGNYVHLYCFEQ
jgi:hypothetical protein